MPLRMSARNVPKKRIMHFSSEMLNYLENKELKWYHKLLGLEKKLKLDQVREKPLNFPEALFPLEKVPIEWWYFTGHLQEKNNRNDTKNNTQKLGYEFCIFKFHPYELRIGPVPLYFFRKKPFLVFHFALTDKSKNNFNFFQESTLFGSQDIDYNQLKINLKSTELKLSDNEVFNLNSKNEIAEIDFKLIPLKKIVKHFHNGYNVNFDHPEHRTYYLTFSRLKTEGKIRFNHKNYEVEGVSWFDHQKLNRPHKSPIVGWDWFSIILDDNTELMLFLLKTKKGFDYQHMGGTYIEKDSKTINISPLELEMKVTKTWKSPKTKIVYPSGWQLNIPKLNLNLKIKPIVKDQELNKIKVTPVTYWEGACEASGFKNNMVVKGQSYVELFGYDQRLITQIVKANTD